MRGLQRALTVCAVLATLGVSDAVAQKTSLVVGSSVQDINKLDPHLTASLDKGMVAWMFNGLVRLAPGQSNPSNIEADLAESWTANEDNTVWDFTIRQGVKCHFGYGEFTAEDAAYSLLRAANADTSGFAGDFAAMKSVEAVDAYHLRITLSHAIPSLLGLVSNYHGGQMVCKGAAEEGAEAFNARPVGTGPFVFAEYQPQQFVRLVANEEYFRGAPQIKEIIYRFIPSDATRDLALESGEVDMINGRQDQSWVSRMSGNANVQVAAMEPAELNTLHLNRAVPPLDDIRVRQAIAHAINRSTMMQLLGPQVSREATSILPAGTFGFHALSMPEYDIEKAKALLAEAGYPDGITIKAIQTTLPSLFRLMEALQAQLREAGINVEIEAVDHPTFHANIRKDLSAIVLYQAARFPVADVYLTQFYHSASTVNTPTAITNFSHCDAADAEIEAARIEIDPDQQAAVWGEAQEKILADLCSVPFTESLGLWAWSTSLDLGYELRGSLNLAPPITELTHFTQ